MAVSFIHCADLHLGTPFKGVADTFGADEKIYQEILQSPEQTFDFIIGFALERKVDFVLFAGDIFDAANVSWRSMTIFSSGIAKLKKAGIKSFVIAGNHDPLPDGPLSKCTQDAILFGKDAVESYNFNSKALISGISFSRENSKKNMAKNFPANDNSDLLHIALYHGNIGGQEGYDNYSPAPLSDLAKSTVDYWALGHIHEKNLLREKNPTVLYCGAPLSRNINENSPKGFYYVCADDFKQITTKFIECGSIGFFRVKSNIDNLADMHEMRAKVQNDIRSAVAGHHLQKYFIELVICGTTELDRELNSQKQEDLRYFIANDLESQFHLGNISIRTSPAISKEDFCRENIFAADLDNIFAGEINNNCPSLQDELDSLKRTFGTLLDTENICPPEITADAEYEILRLLSEVQK